MYLTIVHGAPLKVSSGQRFVADCNSSGVRSLAAVLLAELVLDDLAKVIRTDWLGDESMSTNLAK